MAMLFLSFTPQEKAESHPDSDLPAPKRTDDDDDEEEASFFAYCKAVVHVYGTRRSPHFFAPHCLSTCQLEVKLG